MLRFSSLVEHTQSHANTIIEFQRPITWYLCHATVSGVGTTTYSDHIHVTAIWVWLWSIFWGYVCMLFASPFCGIQIPIVHFYVIMIIRWWVEGYSWWVEREREGLSSLSNGEGPIVVVVWLIVDCCFCCCWYQLRCTSRQMRFIDWWLVGWVCGGYNNLMEEIWLELYYTYLRINLSMCVCYSQEVIFMREQ